MATMIRAITEFRPRVLTRRTIGLDTLTRRLARGSLVTRPIARMMLEEISAEVLTGLSEGNAVQLPGIGRFGLGLSLSGDLRPTFRVDTALRQALPAVSDFPGEITNRLNIGLTSADVAALWNEAHPDDPIMPVPSAPLAA